MSEVKGGRLTVINQTVYDTEALEYLAQVVQGYVIELYRRIPSPAGFENFDPYGDLTKDRTFFISYYSPKDKTAQDYFREYGHPLYVKQAGMHENPCYVRLVRPEAMYASVFEALAEVGEDRFLPEAAVRMLGEFFYSAITEVDMQRADRGSIFTERLRHFRNWMNAKLPQLWIQIHPNISEETRREAKCEELFAKITELRGQRCRLEGQQKVIGKTLSHIDEQIEKYDKQMNKLKGEA